MWVRLALVSIAFAGMALALGQMPARAAEPPAQGFDASGAYALNAGTCWDDFTGPAESPVKVAGRIVCGPHTMETRVEASQGTAVRSWDYVQIPDGNRLATIARFMPMGPSEFSVDATKAVCGTPSPGVCGAGSSVTGSMSGETDLLCGGPTSDVLAASISESPAAWPDDPQDGTGYNGFGLTRTADGAATGAPGGANAYTNALSPFPAAFSFASLDTATVNNAFIGGGGAAFALPNIPLQVYAADSPYRAGLRVSVEMVGGSPAAVPTNDYLCMHTPSDSVTSVEYRIPPTTSGLFPTWVAFTSAPDFENGAIDRILDVECVGTGVVYAGPGGSDIAANDVDDDCLATPGPDTNDANPDQDGDGVPDGAEYYSGSNMNAADADGDGATDFDELFQYTNPNNADTDGDGSLDKQDNGADEITGSLVVDDTIADDNCPAIANATQLNTDSAQSYHGGNDAWNNVNAGTTGSAVPPATQITAFNVVSLVVSGGTATVTTDVLSNIQVNQLIEVSGVTGVGGTAAQDNTYRDHVNGAQVISRHPVGNTFSFNASTGFIDGAAVGTIVIRPATGDPTNPDHDMYGDACDPDDDNDSLPDVAEGNVTIVPWGGPGTTSCVGDGSGAATAIPLRTTNGDSDQDMVLDGIECQQGSRPDVASKTIASCSSAPDPDGCAQPKAAAAGEDGDFDLLYKSGDLIGGNLAAESFYRTMGVSQHGAPPFNDENHNGYPGIQDPDADADWNYGNSTSPEFISVLRDGAEVRYYGTAPSNGDTDVDGCDDFREVMDLNGDRTVNPGDQAIEASRVTLIPTLDNGLAGDPIAHDGQVNPLGINYDLIKDGKINPGDQSVVAFALVKGGGCQSNRQTGRTIGRATRMPF
jgi:hypothetical protein